MAYLENMYGKYGSRGGGIIWYTGSIAIGPKLTASGTVSVEIAETSAMFREKAHKR